MAVKYLSHLETLNINMQGYELQNAVIHTLTNNTRPINPNVGQVIYNTDNQTLELWDGVNWSSVSGDITSITITTGVGLQGGVVGVTGAVTGTISLNHLGLEDLVDPNKDSIFYWNDLTKKSEFLDIGDGLLINSGVLSNTIINNDQLINGSGYITADSSDTLTNKSGNISQWTNDVGYITDGNTNWNNTYGFITGINWDEITGNQLDINLSGFNNDSGFTTFDGDYNSLSNLPTIPTNNNQLINGAGYITNGNDGWVNTYGFITGVNWNEIGGLQSDINLSEFTNDVGFVSGDEFDSSGTYLNLRAQATTKDDVGLGNVENITLSTYTGNGGSLDNQYIINSEGYITGINWDGIGGTQSDINLSGFTNDIGFSTFDGDYNSLTNIPTYTQGSIIFADSDGSLTEDNSQLYWDNVNNRLGIGTTNPTERLDVNGNIKADGILKLFDVINTQTIELNPNGDSYILNGNIGIGTTTPNDKLDIDGDIRVKRTNRKPTHENVLTSDFVSVGSVSFYTDDWIKVKVIGRGDTGLNKSFAEYLIYYDGANYNIESLNNIVIGDNSGFPLLRMNGSNLEIKNRDSVNAGNYLIYFDDFISQTLFSGKTYRVEDFPLIWINDLYYNTYKDNTFVPNQNISIPNQSEYDAVTNIDLDNQNLTTDFTGELLGKFTNLENLYIDINNIDLIDISHNPNIVRAVLNSNGLSTIIFDNNVNSKLRNFNLAVNTLTGSIDLTGLNVLETFFMHYNSITSVTLPSAIGNKLSFMNVSFNQLTDLDLSNSPLLTTVYTQNNKLTAATNSQMLINLDGFGLSNGIFQGSIFGGGFITPTGIDSFNSLLSKSWNIVGLTNQISAGTTYNVEDFPKIWIDNLYYNTYKDNTFVPSVDTLMTGQVEYDAVTTINLSNQSLTTDFTFLDKFRNLINLRFSDNNIDIIDLSKIYNKSLIIDIVIKNNNITTCDLQGFINAVNVLIHTNNISEVDFSDLLSVERLEFYTNNISEVDLSNLSNLDLLIGFQNSLTNIDLSSNTLLTELILYSNSITSIDLSNNTLLTNCRLQSNDLTDIDLSNNTLLTDVRIHNNELDAATNSQVLIDLDSHGLSNGYFQSSIFGGDYLTPLGVESAISLNSKNWNIVGLTYILQTGTSYDVEDFPLAWIEENNFATYSGNTFQVVSDRNMPTQTEYDAVTLISLNGQSLTTNFTNELLSKFNNLSDLHCYNNQISTLDVSQLVNLNTLLCDANQISTLDVSQLTFLTRLHCYNNQISVLDVSQLVNLNFLDCYNNSISVLEVSNLISLTQLRCHNNLISVLDVSNLTGLTILTCQGNSISVLNVSNITGLTTLNCYDNSISILDVSNLTNLNVLRCYDNSISILDVSSLVNLNELRCYNNSISILDVSNLIGLTNLNCQSNSISILDVSNLTSLVQLYCHNNQISVLDISQLISLTDLRCQFNQISVLDVSQLVNLTYLSCFNNQISLLGVSNLVNLDTLYCHNNQLDAASNSQILIDLDNNGLSNGYFQSTIFGGGSLTAAGQTAKTNLLSKGWTIVGI